MAQSKTAAIEPISLQRQKKVREKAHKITRSAAKKLGQVIVEPETVFDLSGRSAGMCCSRGERLWIRFNPYIFAKYYESNFRDTVPHEVAHYLVARVFKGWRVQPHGQEWTAMMKLLGAKPERTHGYDLAGVPVKRQRRHLYHCGCTEHQLSSTRHNRVLRSQQSYLCRRCGNPLVYAQRSID